MKALTLTATAAALVCSAGLLTGCGLIGTTSGANAGSGDVDKVQDAPVASEAGQDDTAQSESDVKQFGQTWTYEDGLAVTIKYLGSGHASSTAAGAESTHGAMQLFRITLANGSKKTVDGSLALIDSVTVGADGDDAEEVFDSERGLDGADFTKITPGRKQSFKVGYAIKGAKTVQVQFSAGTEYDSVIYEGKMRG